MTIQKEWYAKLAKEGFNDIEDKKGNLKQYDRRTIAFDNREAIFDFFTKLDHLLEHRKDIPQEDRDILHLYSQGIQLNNIAKLLTTGIWNIKRTIKRYKLLLLSPQLCRDQNLE